MSVPRALLTRDPERVWQDGRVDIVVELAGGVEGLLHISETGLDASSRLEDRFKIGDDVGECARLRGGQRVGQGVDQLFAHMPGAGGGASGGPAQMRAHQRKRQLAGEQLVIAVRVGATPLFVLKAGIELVAAIPSVVLGLIGITVLAPWIKQLFNLRTGLTALTGAGMTSAPRQPSVGTSLA